MPKNRIYIWGTGRFAEILFSSIDESLCEILGAIDNDPKKQGTLWQERIPVFGPETLLGKTYDYILVSNKKYDKIVEQCNHMQINTKQVKCIWNMEENIPFINMGCYISALSNYYLSLSQSLKQEFKCDKDILNQYNVDLRREKELLQRENEQLKHDNAILNQHNTILRAEKELLEKEKKQLQKDLKDCRWNLDFAIRREKLFEQEAPFEYSEICPKILPAEELLKQLIKEQQSVCRFGDGELELMLGKARPWFQSPDNRLSQRLQEVFYSNNSNILIAVSDNFGDLRKYTSEAAYYIRDYLKDGKRQKLLRLLDKNRIYYDAYVSRPYLMYRDKSHATVIFELFKKLWKNRKVLLVEGEYIRSGVNNNLFDGVEELRRIICPSKNAFDFYDEILNAIVENVEDDLVLLALGPTATVLAYDVALKGIQAIDLGQIDNEYEWFLAGEENRAEISGKAVPEREELHEVGACNDPMYIKQVIKRIGC